MNLEHQFAGEISGNLLYFRQMPNGTYKFQCPYCQRGARHKSGRAWKDRDCASYFYEREGALNFSCHKCGTKRQFHNFLKDHFPNQFIAYVKEREQRGTTGKGHNCPTLTNALESIGGAMFAKPDFRKQQTKQEPKTEKAEKASLPQPDQGCGNPPKFQKLEGMKSPEQQAGCQSRMNHLIKQKRERERKRRGDLW